MERFSCLIPKLKPLSILVAGLLGLVPFSNAEEAKLPPVSKSDAKYIEKFLPYKDSLNAAISRMDFPKTLKESIPGQIEQETCASAKSRKCWNPRAELKTSRELGFGLGQLTITDKFSGFEEVKQYKELKDWQWEDRYNPEMQIRGIIIKNRIAYNMIKWTMVNEYEKMAAMYAAYNGGVGGLLSDRRLTLSSGGDTSKWFGGIELYSKKSKVPHPEYKVSFFDINRSYPKNILTIRMMKYKPWMEEISNGK